MDQLASVKGKLDCLFEIAILDKQSSKRPDQGFMVSATETLRTEAKEHGIEEALATEKIDGTCVFIKLYNGTPWLWARHDRKLKKFSEKSFRKFQKENPGKEYPWNFQNDFKPVPPDWLAAANIEVRKDGMAVPDNNGHTPGWVPVDPTNSQHVWHLSAVDLQKGTALQLKEIENQELKICFVSLTEIVDHTAELIGTFVNGNPYGLGTKKLPLHFLVVHGSVKSTYEGPIRRMELKNWFMTEPSGAMEGIVWHCRDGALFKLHRFHMNSALAWPISDPALSTRRKVTIDLDIDLYETPQTDGALHRLIDNNGKTFDSLRHMGSYLFDNPQPQTKGQHTASS